MLRSKKFNIYKHEGLNYIFDFCKDERREFNIDFENIDKEEYISNVIIKTTDDFEIVKEVILETYLMVFKELIIIHLREEFIKDFEFLYKKSSDYVFEIYKTEIPHLTKDETINIYHIFCISKRLIDKPDYISFLNANDSDIKYTCLTVFYGSCILLNRRFDITSEYDKFNARYTYVKTIGQGVIDYKLKSLVKTVISVGNMYHDMLPPHYLKI
jgi:hypothetical protein